MKHWFALCCLPLLLAATGPVPLVTGAVRDQFGEPIAGATVSAGAQTTVTDAGGTFALQSVAHAVRISCAYCRTSVVAVSGDHTVAAILERYRAVQTQTISHADLQQLPYAHFESAVALQPFVVLNDSQNVLPGPHLTFYGLSQFGGLLVDNGVPSYDIAAGATPLRAIPAFDTESVTTRDQRDAFRYGDLASGGTFYVRTQPASGWEGVALEGSERAFELAQTAPAVSYALSSSADGSDTRTRFDAGTQYAQAGNTLAANIFGARDRYDNSPDGTADSSATALRLHLDRVRAAHTYADLIVDRNGYSATAAPGQEIDGEWSDVSIQTGINSLSPISTFADLGTRFSTGYYNAIAAGGSRVAGTIRLTHLSSGAQGRAKNLAWQAGIGAFDVTFNGGLSGPSTPQSTQILAPSVSVAYDIAPQWNLAIDANQSFRLPTLIEAYGYGADLTTLHFDRYGTQTATLTYTDLQRVRASIIGMNAHVSSLDNGTIRAAGASLAWQIAPTISLRAWTLHVGDTSRPYADVYRFGTQPQDATPAALWLSYENPHGIRTDAVWRRDLIDYKPNVHFDASVSGPLVRDLRWIAGTEQRGGTRYVFGGIRFERP